MWQTTVGIISSLISLAVGIVSTAMNNWTLTSTDTSEVYRGLWKVCIYVNKVEVSCSDIDYDNVGDWIRACQAMMIMGLVSLCLSKGGAIYTHVKKAPTKVTVAGAVLSGTCSLIAVIVFATNVNGDTLHVGFWLAVVAAVLAFTLALFKYFQSNATNTRTGYSTL